MGLALTRCISSIFMYFRVITDTSPFCPTTCFVASAVSTLQMERGQKKYAFHMQLNMICPCDSAVGACLLVKLKATWWPGFEFGCRHTSFHARS